MWGPLNEIQAVSIGPATRISGRWVSRPSEFPRTPTTPPAATPGKH